MLHSGQGKHKSAVRDAPGTRPLLLRFFRDSLSSVERPRSPCGDRGLVPLRSQLGLLRAPVEPLNLPENSPLVVSDALSFPNPPIELFGALLPLNRHTRLAEPEVLADHRFNYRSRLLSHRNSS